MSFDIAFTNIVFMQSTAPQGPELQFTQTFLEPNQPLSNSLTNLKFIFMNEIVSFNIQDM